MNALSSKDAPIVKVAVASTIGTTIEWYNFFIYNMASLLVFKGLFFEEGASGNTVFKALAVYAVGFVARPFGGIICGHFGDRKGRKMMLVYTLLLSGIATFAIGLLDGRKQWGVWAPLLLVLLRFAQGFAVGGEWGGAVVMVVEHAAERHSRWRGLLASLPQFGVPAGLFLASAAFLPIMMLPAEERGKWLWRVPFLLSIVLVAVGAYIRNAIVDSSVFTNLRQREPMPIMKTLRQYPGDSLRVIGAKVAENGVFYFYTAFIFIFANKGITEFYKYEPASVIYATMIAAALLMVSIPAFGALSDRVGRKPVYLIGTLLTALAAFPSFWLIDSGRPVLMGLALVFMLAVCWGAMYAPQASFFAEMFHTGVRYSGVSLGGQVATIFAGGAALLVAERLLVSAKSTWPIALMIVGMAVVTAVAVALSPETYLKDLASEPESLSQAGQLAA